VTLQARLGQADGQYTDMHASWCRSFPRRRYGQCRVARQGLPCIWGRECWEAYKLGRGTYDAYALACPTSERGRSFPAGGGGSTAWPTLIKRIRAGGRGKRAAVYGGDSWQGSYTGRCR